MFVYYAYFLFFYFDPNMLLPERLYFCTSIDLITIGFENKLDIKYNTLEFEIRVN